MEPNSTRKNLGTFAALIGVALLLWVAAEVLERREDQQSAKTELSQLPPPLEMEDREDQGEARPLKPRPQIGDLVGRIVIPRAGIDAVAVEGIDLETLKTAAGHFPGTALPGEPGNSSFAAHRDSFFRGLRHVEVGNDVEIETPEAIYTYRVEETRIVPPTQVDVVEPRGGRDLTLITCYPFDFVGAAPQRFVVHARWLSERERTPAATGSVVAKEVSTP